MLHRLLFCLVVCFATPGFAQKYSFVVYSTEQGLPQSQVTSITEDSSGYLWIGTLGGLARFNGKEFQTYSSKNGLINNEIRTLNYFDNKLWVGHDGGISFFDNEQIIKVPFSGTDKSKTVSRIIRFGDKILVCSNGGGLFELKGKKLIKRPLGEEDYERIRDAHRIGNKIYLATRKGVIYSSNGVDFKPYYKLPVESFSSICSNADFVVFTTYTAGVYLLHKKSGTWTFVPPDKVEYPIFGSHIDSKNELWLHTQSGIIRRTNDGAFSLLNEEKGLPVNMVSCLYMDRNDHMWIGSQGKGFFRFPGSVFTYYDQSTGLPSELFLCGFQRKNGDYVLGTYDKGILLKTAQGEVRLLNTTESTLWAAVQNVNGKDWFGGQTALISMDERGNFTYYEENLPGTKITALYRINQNQMYIGGSEGVARYTGKSFIKVGGASSLSIGTVRDFEIVNDTLYCATNLGVFKLQGDKFIPIFSKPIVVYNLERDDQQQLYFGTEDGLYRYHSGKTQRIELLHDPGSNIINFMNFREGDLYLGTNNGLFILSDLDNKTPTMRRFGIGEGMVDLETNLNSGFFDNQGRFWFGTASGLICYNPKGPNLESTRPLLNLKSIKLNYQSFDYTKYSDELWPNGLPKSLRLPYTKNNLVFELDGISLVNHRGLRFQFLLEGLNTEWSPLTAVSSITFTSLPAGVYTLKMRAVDMDGRRSDEIVFPFEIAQAFYKTWWFFASLIALISILVITLFRIRLKRINDRNEKELLIYRSKLLALEQKSVNASMNRHFIFNALNSIQYFINTQDRLSANKYLTNFAQLIRKNLDAANAETDAVSLEEELSRIRLYLSLESMRFKDKFDYEIVLDDLDAEEIKIPFMLMQPFVENAIMHGILPNEGVFGHIWIHVYLNENVLHIVIRDNGIGINQSLEAKSEPDGDHRSQGVDITTKRIELLRIISKHNMELIGPYETHDQNGSVNGTEVLIKIPLDYLEKQTE